MSSKMSSEFQTLMAAGDVTAEKMLGFYQGQAEEVRSRPILLFERYISIPRKNISWWFGYVKGWPFQYDETLAKLESTGARRSAELLAKYVKESERKEYR